MKVYILVLLSLIVMLSVPVYAHHSQVTFYFLDRTVEITGIVTELRLVNPHSYMHVEVTEANGEKVTWTVYGGNRAEMSNEAGWEVGRTITAVGCPARNPAARGMYLGSQCPGTALTLLSGQ